MGGGGKRLRRRVVGQLGPRFADYVVVDGGYAAAPFLHLADELGLKTIVRLKANLPSLFNAAKSRFACRPPSRVFKGWSRSGGNLGRGRLRSLGPTELVDRARDPLPARETQWIGGRSLLADQFLDEPSGSAHFISHGQESLGSRKPRFRRCQRIVMGWPTSPISTPTAYFCTGSS